MTKKAIIILLSVLCSFLAVYAFYQKTLAEKAKIEAIVNLQLAEEQRQLAMNAEQKAIESQARALEALEESNAQRQKLEEALKKCR